MVDASNDALRDAVTDSGTPSDGMDGPRCSPSGAWGTPVLLANVNSPLGVWSLTMTSDELTGFFTASDNGADYVLKMATRASPDGDFSSLTAAPTLGTITSATGMESYPTTSGDGLLLYFVRANPVLYLASRRTGGLSGQYPNIWVAKRAM